jgi:hypothetical protein
MKIKTTTTIHMLFRTTILPSGRRVDTPIRNVPVGTEPTAIPPEIAQDLTPTEFKELVTFLASEQQEILARAVERLIEELDAIVPKINEESLDESLATRLGASLRRCSLTTRRAMRNKAKANEGGASGTVA